MGSRHVVDIAGLDDEGRGRALLDDGAADEVRVDVAVRGAFPGDRAAMVVERLFPARRLAVGRATEILAAGEARGERLCEHLPPTVCCPLDGLSPSAQVALKRERVLVALRDAGLGHLEALVEDVVLPPAAAGRRQKVKLVAGGAPGRLRLGLYAPWSRVLVEAHACAYERPELAEAAARLLEALDEARVSPASREPAGLRAVILRAFAEGVGAVLVTGAPLEDEAWAAASRLIEEGALASLAERVDPVPGGSLVGGAITRAQGPVALSPLEGGPPAAVDAFCQPDPELAREMYALVARFVAEAPPGPIVDAYAGTGGFSRALLAAGRPEIVAIERAEASLPALRALGVEAVGAAVEDAVGTLSSRGPLAGVIADPPKKGLADAAAPLASLAAPRFALVSCDPDAMARDVGVLLGAGYTIARIVPVDLFSGTPEVEVVTFLLRS